MKSYVLKEKKYDNVAVLTCVPCIKMTTNTPQTPRKTELKGAIPSAVRSLSIEHHSARFSATKREGEPVDSRAGLECARVSRTLSRVPLRARGGRDFRPLR